MKGKICIGIGQILISNKKQKIEIYPETYKNISKKIKLIIFCDYTNNKKNTNEKILKSPDRASSNTNNFNNCNTNNTSTLSLSSCVSQAIQNKIKTTPLNKITNKNKKYYRNKSQTTLVENAKNININKNKNKRIYIGLRQKNIYMHDKINDNSTIFSERTNKRHLSGNFSLNSYFSENIKKNHKKIFSPKMSIYSNPLYNENISDINGKRRNKNNSMIIYNEKKNNFNNIFKFSNDINMDNINNQIEKYIMDKSFEDEVQNDVPLIYPQEKKKYLNKENINENKFEMLLNDFLLLYNNENIKNFNINEMELEFHFFVEKIYELIIEYYREYHSLINQNNSFINNIKYYSYEYNCLLKLQNTLKRKITKEILKNKNIKSESSKKLLKNILSIVVNKNKSALNQKEITNLNKINIKINENKKVNQSKIISLNYLNKRKINNNIHLKNQNDKKRTSLDSTYRKSKNTLSKDKKLFESDKFKIKVKIRSIYS